DGISTLDAIRGDQYVQNASIYQYIEGPLAVVGGYVRTTGAVPGLSGGEYATAPSLTVSPTGNTWTNNITAIDPDFSEFWDGTSDGRRNYTIDVSTGTVIATDLQWGGDGEVLFSTETEGDVGITYDRWNNSLWILNHDTGLITDYSLTGEYLSSFYADDIDIFGTALAMDIDRTLWFVIDNSGIISHYDIEGNWLGEDFYDPLGYSLGGEIAAVPEPGTLAMASLMSGLFGMAWLRRRTSLRGTSL
ncbi:MAG: PEP-CTERM sorting domain-containing protein, partial [Planctomycetes bacterium]|nr:PEP-CTERM sorting domain-containing protein [Planctomycetota bacterium]